MWVSVLLRLFASLFVSYILFLCVCSVVFPGCPFLPYTLIFIRIWRIYRLYILLREETAMFWISGMVTCDCLLRCNKDCHLMRVFHQSASFRYDTLSVTSFTASYNLLVKMKCFGVIWSWLWFWNCNTYNKSVGCCTINRLWKWVSDRRAGDDSSILGYYPM